MLTSQSLTKFLLVVSLVSFFWMPALASIGTISDLESPGKLKREAGPEFDTELDTPVEMNDEIETFQGSHRITFVDDTVVDMTPQSILLIDDYVYAPEQNVGSLKMKAQLGTLRYASGKLAEGFKENVIIETPTSTIGVRGTDFTMTVDELGSSTIILLPSCDISGNCYVGEIRVETDVGVVILNQAFQATYTNSRERPPSPVVKLELTEDLINNLLIIRKKTIVEDETAGYKKVEGVLDIDFLDFKELDKDYLAESTAATHLDIDYLAFDLLPDILEVINEQLEALMTKDNLASLLGLKKKKAEVSQDTEQGIVLIDDGITWHFTRTINQNTISLKMRQDSNYTLNVNQDDLPIFDYELGGPGGNDVQIYQSSN